MKRITVFLALVLMLLSLPAFAMGGRQVSSEEKDQQMVNLQQKQYAAAQPVPFFNWSLERHLATELYKIRNSKAVTHAVWRSDMGMIEGDCPSMGFGIPYDVSLTNPLQMSYAVHQTGTAVVEQAEPNGLYASKNTSATWVMCTGTGGVIEPVYVEGKVTVYPYPVTVDYDKNRVTKAGKSSVTVTVPSASGQ